MTITKFLVLIFAAAIFASCSDPNLPNNISRNQTSDVSIFRQKFRNLCNDRRDVVSQLRIASPHSDAYFNALAKASAFESRLQELDIQAYQISRSISKAAARELADKLRNECYIDKSTEEILQILESEEG